MRTTLLNCDPDELKRIGMTASQTVDLETWKTIGRLLRTEIYIYQAPVENEKVDT